MNDTCNECGGNLPADAVGNRCPRCLLALALDESAFAESTLSSDCVFERLGDYELHEEIARGGMGVVYKARQVSLKRTVALKLILSGQFASKKEVQRFQVEAEAAAHLRHPNIVPIYETGEHNGRHFFSMELVRGRNLSELVKERIPAPRVAAQYAETIAKAIHYAHEQGILHRDLKPSNILVDSDDQPRITDFGLALRLDDESELTATGQMLGSPNFMPPEQASRDEVKIGPRSDVYGIGAILYHLLTGHPPFQAAALKDVIKHLQENEPVAPRLLNPATPRDLETICLKCLDKNPERRYRTALELADELGRFREDKPILTRPLRMPERLWRWARRRPLVTGLIAAVALTLVLGAGGVLYQLQRVKNLAADLRERVYASEVNLAARALSEKNLGRAVQLLEHQMPRAGERDLRGFEWRYLWSLCKGNEIATLKGHEAEVSALAATPDGHWLLTSSFDHSLRIWDLPNRKLHKTLRTFTRRIYIGSLALSPDGAMLAVTDDESLWVWETATWREIHALGAARLPVAFVRAGKTLVATTGDPRSPSLKAWDTTTWQSTLVATNAYGAAGSPDGNTIAVARIEHGRPNGVQILNSDDRMAGMLDQSDSKIGRIDALVFSPNGQWIAAGGMKGEVCVWDARTLRLATCFQPHNSFVSGLAFSPDSQLLATGGATEQIIQLWKAPQWEKAGELTGHHDGIWCLTFTTNGNLLSGSRDRTVKIWDPMAPAASGVAPSGPILAGFIPNTQKAVVMKSTEFEVWDYGHSQQAGLIPLTAGKVNISSTVSPNGALVAAASSDGSVEIRELPSGALRRTVNAGTNPVLAQRFSPDAKTLAVISTSTARPTLVGRLSLWAVANGREVTSISEQVDHEGTALAFSNNGQHFAVARSDGSVSVFALADARERWRLRGHTWDVPGLAFTPDDVILASASWDRTVRLWDMASGKLKATLTGHPLGASSLCFSPDGRTLAVNSMGNTLTLWSVRAQQELAALHWTGTFMGDVKFSPDGTVVAAGSFPFVLTMGFPVPDRVQFWHAPATE